MPNNVRERERERERERLTYNNLPRTRSKNQLITQIFFSFLSYSFRPFLSTTFTTCATNIQLWNIRCSFAPFSLPLISYRRPLVPLKETSLRKLHRIMRSPSGDRGEKRMQLLSVCDNLKVHPLIILKNVLKYYIINFFNEFFNVHFNVSFNGQTFSLS